MNYVQLKDVCVINMGQSPDSNSYNDCGEGLPFFQGNADFGEMYPVTRKWCSSPTKIASENDILISVRAPIGALNYAKESCCIGRGLAALTPNKSKVSPAFIFWLLKSKNEELNSKGTGSTFKAIGRKVLEETLIPNISLGEQMVCAKALEKIYYIMQTCQQQLQKLDDLVKARFVEMFGDPVTNPMDWPTKPLLEMGYCKNGMNFHTGDSGIEMHCLGVGDFKDYSVIDGTDYLPTISLNEAPPEESMLQDGDLVFVRSNGNKALVGRCLLVYPHNTPTTYSGFCIRYRLTSAEVNIAYLLRVLKTDSMRKKMAGRGANIQNLNQQILAALNIPTPPLELQEWFTAFIEQIDKSKVAVQKSLDEAQLLFDSLMQHYFG